MSKTATKTKAERKAEKKANRGKRFLKGLGIFLVVVLCIAAVTAIVNTVGNAANKVKAESFPTVEYDNQLVPEKDARGNYTFVTDNAFKVLQLTDVHIGGGWLSFKKDAMSINACAAMISAEKPDLVIVTGDIAYPVPFQAGTFNNMPPAQIFASMMEKLGVYWTLAFGNHDTEIYSYFSRERISELYSSDAYPHCLFQTGPDDVDGYGNQIIAVKNTQGVLTQLLYVLDSHTYTDGDYLGFMWKYDNIHANQVQWYADTLKEYQADNDAAYAALGMDKIPPLKSCMFFHIPLTEYKDAWYSYVENGQKDTEDVHLVYGTAGESKKVVYCGMGEDDMFETVQELGSTQAIFCGHDHLNNFSLDYKGIRLTYGRSIDYLAYAGIYKLGSQRGCTVITLSPDGSFDCTAESYYQEKYTSFYAKEDVTMQEMEVVTEFPED